MIIECTSCGSKYKYDESKLAGVAAKKVKCPKCKGIIEVTNPEHVALSDEPVSAEKLQKTYASVASPGYETQPSSSTSESALDQTSPPSSAPDAPKTSKVKRDTLTGNTAAPGLAENLLKMPEYLKISLAVISGNNSGEIFQVNKPRMVIGRGEVEMSIKDPEASREHARIDVIGDRVILRDLNSTNGTFVNEQKIATMTLENHSEFRIGTTVFMLIITELD